MVYKMKLNHLLKKALVLLPVLCFGLVLIGSAGVVQTIVGSNILGRMFRGRLWLFVGILVTGLLAGWAIKLASGYNSGQYPTH